LTPRELDIGRRYLAETRYAREGMPSPRHAFPRTSTYKEEYPGDLPRLALAMGPARQEADFWEIAARRRSERQYGERSLTREELAALLWATQGLTLTTAHYQFRAAPSAGGLYPVETYLAVHRVQGVEPGVWHFRVQDFALELLKGGDCRRAVVEACLGQLFMGAASAVFIWTGVLNRSMWKYRERAIRYLFLDAGHICQNLMLAATALGLGCCPVGAFFDGEVEKLVQVDPDQEAALYLASVGPPTEKIP